MINDPDYARGVRAPGPIPGRGAWINVQAIRKAVLFLYKLANITLLESEAKTALLGQIDAVGAYAEVLVLRQDRSGPAEGSTDLSDMEATLRLAAKSPDQFKAFDLEGLKAKVALIKGVKPKK